MTFFNKLFQEILGCNKKSNFEDKGLLLKENIKHSQIFLNNYNEWLGKEMHHDILQYFYQLWAHKLKHKAAEVNLYLHESNLSNGFYFKAETRWNSEDYCFFIHYITEKLQARNYTLNHATREVIEEGGLLKTIELFYLKPSLEFRKTAPFEQFFGNIEIQHRMVNGETTIVKLVANTYSDRRYKKAYDFEDLMNFIFVL